MANIRNYIHIGDYRFEKDDGKLIGRGPISEVYLADITDPDAPDAPNHVAVKIIEKRNLPEDADKTQRIYYELKLLSEIKGERIVHIDPFETDDSLYMFMQYCNEGSLKEKIELNGLMSEDEGLNMVKQIAEIFNSFNLDNLDNSGGNKTEFMHRNINPKNILFHNGEVMLADFTSAKILDEVDRYIRTAHTPVDHDLYDSPQIIDLVEYSAKCDVWSMGIVLYESIFGWENLKPAAFLTYVKERSCLPPQGIVCRDTRDLIVNMLKNDEKDRYSWSQVYSHPAIQNLLG